MSDRTAGRNPASTGPARDITTSLVMPQDRSSSTIQG